MPIKIYWFTEIEKLHDLNEAQEEDKPCQQQQNIQRLTTFKKTRHITHLRQDFASDSWLSENTWKLIERN